MTIEHLGDLTPDSKNARRHNPRNVGMIVDALHEVGAARSIVIDEHGNVLAGNATIEAAAQAGIERVRVVDADGETLVAVRRTGLTEEQKTRLALYDNRTAELADWDPEALAAIMADDGALDGLFSDLELVDILGDLLKPEVVDDPGAQVDKAAELQEKWGTVPGQVWEVGDHRIVCGDCTDAAVVEAVMQGERADLLFTDPPYGINYEPQAMFIHGDNHPPPHAKSGMPNDDGSLDLTFLWSYSKRLVWGFPYIYDSLATGWLVWDKHPGLEGESIGNPVELASCTLWEGFKIKRLLWGGYYRAAGEERGPHPTQKPGGVTAPYIKQYTSVGAVIYDPFLGSGTTAVACQQLGRKCRGVEIEPKYVAVTLERLAGMGLEPGLVE